MKKNLSYEAIFGNGFKNGTKIQVKNITFHYVYKVKFRNDEF